MAADRRPLIIVAGVMQELPVGDTVAPGTLPAVAAPPQRTFAFFSG